MNHNEIQCFTEKWIDAWNRADVEALMALFSKDVENTTPLIKTYLGIDTGKLKGNGPVAEFWKGLMDKYQNLELSVIQLWNGIETVSINWCFKAGDKEKTGIDMFFFNEQGLVYKIETNH